MKTGYSVRDAMSTRPVTVKPGLSVRDAAVVMREAEIGSLLIVDDEGALCGIITAEDFVYRVAAQGGDAGTTPIEQVMTRDLVDVRPETDITEAMLLMREHDIYHLPVRDEVGRLVGFLTLKDVLAIEPQLFELMEEKAELGVRRARRPHEGFCAECGNWAGDLAPVEGRLVCGYCQDTV